jgi:hypothetical protein
MMLMQNLSEFPFGGSISQACPGFKHIPNLLNGLRLATAVIELSQHGLD